jgi:hypothetical protein
MWSWRKTGRDMREGVESENVASTTRTLPARPRIQSTGRSLGNVLHAVVERSKSVSGQLILWQRVCSRSDRFVVPYCGVHERYDFFALKTSFVQLFAVNFTYDHRTLKTRLPVRSALFKQRTGGLVVRWVTTSEYPLLYVFVGFCTCSQKYFSFVFYEG